MLAYIARRLLLALFTTWSITVLAFVVIQLPPGDFVDQYILELLAGGGLVGSSNIQATMEINLRHQYGLDRPLFVQYGKWVWKMGHGDFGTSLEFAKPVIELVRERLLMTVILAGTTALFAWGVSIPIGIYSAVRQHSIEDYTFTFIGFMGLAVPDFLLALWLLWITFVYFPDHDEGQLFDLNADPGLFRRLHVTVAVDGIQLV